jgi:hypothetical protein
MYRFKKAETQAELDQVFRLNHDVFAGELGQYEEQSERRLVDKFHCKNLYVIAMAEDRLVGMLSAHDQPPFSVAARLPDPAALDSWGRLTEVRLLAIHPDHRSGMVLTGLLLHLYEYIREYDAVAISGYVEQATVYHKLGFHDLGPPVRSGEADYIPMAATVAELERRARVWKRRMQRAGYWL